MNKKPLIIAGVIGLLVLVGVGYGVKSFLSGGSKVEETTSKKTKMAPPVNVIPVEERAYVKLLPNSNGKNLNLVVEEIKKEAESAEYELEYQAGTLLQGAFGEISLSAFPARTDILLGSCSAGGACTYHEDVQGGSLLLNLDCDEDYGLKSEWKYIENSDDEEEFSSRDAKFQISSEDLDDVSYLVIYNSPGYPQELEGSLVSEVYSLTASSSLTGEAELSIRMTEEVEGVIMGWDGSEWQEFDTSVDGKMATATVDLMEAYLVVSQ